MSDSYSNHPIIYLENDPDDQLIIQRILIELEVPYPVRFFDLAKEALEYLRTTQDRPLVILCDVKMPEMDGMELRDQIEANSNLRQKAIPFVFLSTWVDPEIVEEAYRDNIQGFFQKKANYGEFKNEIKSVLDYWQLCIHPNGFKPQRKEVPKQ